MIVYYLFVHKKSVWKRKVYNIFIKNKKFKKTQKKPFLVGFFWWFFLGFFGWVFLGGFFNANPDLEPLKGFGINFFGSYHPLIYLYISLIMIIKGETTRNPWNTLFKILAGVSKIIAAFAVATAFRV